MQKTNPNHDERMINYIRNNPNSAFAKQFAKKELRESKKQNMKNKLEQFAKQKMTRADIARKLKKSNEYIRQLYIGYGVVPYVCLKPKQYKEIKCPCGKTFVKYVYHRKRFCSRKCSGVSKRKNRTKEDLLDYHRKRANKYYNEVLKHRKDWKQIVKERNDRAARKKKLSPTNPIA